jgi:predicted transcriptional regulator
MIHRLAALWKDVSELPEERQQDVVHILETILAQEKYEPRWTPEQLAQIQAGLDEADRGEFVSDTEVDALFADRRW